MTKLALGLMSGTSADGLTISAVQVDPFQIKYFKNYPYSKTLQQKLLQVIEDSCFQLGLGIYILRLQS